MKLVWKKKVCIKVMQILCRRSNEDKGGANGGRVDEVMKMKVG